MSISTIEYAPIVFGRTYEVDFRFLVLPEDFQSPDYAENRAWAEHYIGATMLLPQHLRDQPRWSIFKSENHCVVGLTCTASAVSTTQTHDRQGRPLYVFLGYVFRPMDVQPLPMKPEEFDQLYHFIAEAWNDKSFATRSRFPEIAQYQTKTFKGIVEPKRKTQIDLNCYPDTVHVWSDEFREALWEKVSYTNRPTSLCIGLPSPSAALRGEFENATVAETFSPHQDSEMPQVLYRQDRQIVADREVQEIDSCLEICDDEPKSQINPIQKAFQFFTGFTSQLSKKTQLEADIPRETLPELPPQPVNPENVRSWMKPKAPKDSDSRKEWF
jgi:hypothetical protein